MASRARIARAAYRPFGKSSGQPARLAMGDCCSHPLALELDEPLLFRGDAFKLTIEIAIEPIRERRLSEIVANHGATQ